jgi:hypothetical protein
LELHDGSPTGGKPTVFENSTLGLPGASCCGEKRVESLKFKVEGEMGRAREGKKITLRRREHGDLRRKTKRRHHV